MHRVGTFPGGAFYGLSSDGQSLVEYIVERLAVGKTLSENGGCFLELFIRACVQLRVTLLYALGDLA